MWVVKTLPALAASRASAKDSFCSFINRRMRLQGEKSGVALVHVAYRGCDAKGIQGSDAPYTEHYLLAHPHVRIATVQPVRHVPVLRAIGRDVRVQQVQRNPANLHLPHLRPRHPARELHLDCHGASVRLALQHHRHGVEVVVRILLALPAVHVQILAEVSLLVEQPHANQGKAEVTRGLEMISRQHTQST